MITADYVVVGSGLTGATIAKALTDAGREVVVLEKRDHIGGNVYDHVDERSGVRVHTYGPHYFRTNSEKIWDYVNRFATWYTYEPRLLTSVDAVLYHWPLHKNEVVESDPHLPDHVIATNFEEAALKLMPKAIYDTFIKEYNEKQWGVKCTDLAADLCKRFEVRTDGETRLMRHKWQALPDHGYARMMQRMLGGIDTTLGFDYLANRQDVTARKKLIYTGPVDALCGYSLGRLRWRGQRRVHTWRKEQFVQSCGQVNNPTRRGGPHVRTLEWKHMMRWDEQQWCQGTVLTTEVPIEAKMGEEEYPFPSSEERMKAQVYREQAMADGKTFVCGRLGDYKYYDMDQAIARAMVQAEEIMK